MALSIAMVGTRGVPARYGGFETAVEEVGRRLAARGHHVRVYCRSGNSDQRSHHQGMELVTLPAVRHRSLETLSHSGLSVAHLCGSRTDVAFVFNAANAPWLPLLRLRRIPVATHVDGLEWRRSKWGPTGQRYYRAAELSAVRLSDALIADAPGIARYYANQFSATTSLITYGAPIQEEAADDRLGELGLRPGEYHLLVARFEPENHVDLMVEGARAAGLRHPLIVVGSAPYSDEYTSRVRSLAGDDPLVRLVGGVWDGELLDQLYGNALTYLHGHSVGGTNPSLLRAIGGGAATIAYDVDFNRDVLGEDGVYVRTLHDVAAALRDAESDPARTSERGARLRDRARQYDWDEVTDGYEALAEDLAQRRTPGPYLRARRAEHHDTDVAGQHG